MPDYPLYGDHWATWQSMGGKRHILAMAILSRVTLAHPRPTSTPTSYSTVDYVSGTKVLVGDSTSVLCRSLDYHSAKVYSGNMSKIIVLRLKCEISVARVNDAIDSAMDILPLADGRNIALGHYAPSSWVELPHDGYDVVAICYPATARKLGHPAIGNWDEVTYCEAVEMADGGTGLAIYPASESYILPNGNISHHALD